MISINGKYARYKHNQMTNKEIYTIWVQSQNELPVFMQPWWMDAVCAGKQWDVLLSLDPNSPNNETDEMPIVRAAMPYMLRKRLGMRFIIMPQLTQIGGIWIDPSYRSQVLEICNDIATQIDGLHLAYYYQHFPCYSPCPKEFAQLGFTIRDRITYRIDDLSNLNDVERHFSRNKRRQLQKAQDVHLSADNNLSAEEFYRFHTRCLMQKRRHISYSREFLLVLERKSARLSQSRFIAIRNTQDRLIAAGFIVWDKCYAHYLLAAEDNDYRNQGGMAMLVLECIKLAKEQNVLFDFEGSMIRGVAKHFKQFAGSPTVYCGVEKYYNRWFRIFYSMYHFINRFRR